MTLREPACSLEPLRAALRGWLVAFLLLLAGAIVLPLAADEGKPDPQVTETRTQIKQLQLEKEQLKRQLESSRASEAEILAEIERLTREVREAKRRERDLHRKRRALDRESARRRARINELRKNSAASRARIGQHLRRMYRLSKIQDSASLISLARYKSYFKDSRYLEWLSRLDREALARNRKLGEELNAAQEAAKTTRAELAEVIANLREERDVLAEKEMALQASVARMRENQQLYRRYLGDLDQALEGMAAALLQIEQDRRRARMARGLSDPETLAGRLPPPVEGRIVAAFGQQDPRYSLKKFQRGIVIRVGESSPVRAVAPGKVVHAGPFRGYQQLVVLDHGQGFFTVYGHLEDLEPRKGDWVETGTVLGHSTYQPVDAGYSVYFEVRLKGVPQDPLHWLKPGTLTLAAISGQG